jgi:hypothetical protein
MKRGAPIRMHRSDDVALGDESYRCAVRREYGKAANVMLDHEPYRGGHLSLGVHGNQARASLPEQFSDTHPTPPVELPATHPIGTY